MSKSQFTGGEFRGIYTQCRQKERMKCMVGLTLTCTFLAILFCTRLYCLPVAKDVKMIVFCPAIVFKGYVENMFFK